MQYTYYRKYYDRRYYFQLIVVTLQLQLGQVSYLWLYQRYLLFQQTYNSMCSLLIELYFSFCYSRATTINSYQLLLHIAILLQYYIQYDQKAAGSGERRQSVLQSVVLEYQKYYIVQYYTNNRCTLYFLHSEGRCEANLHSLHQPRGDDGECDKSL